MAVCGARSPPPRWSKRRARRRRRQEPIAAGSEAPAAAAAAEAACYDFARLGPGGALTTHYCARRGGLGARDAPVVVLLPGFGVGEFHQAEVAELLAADGCDVYALDLYGQGKSWPDGADMPEGLQLSAATWVEQVAAFLEDVVRAECEGQPLFLAGNSVGGFLAVKLAAERPELVDGGVVLFNATPFWGFAPNPRVQPGLARLMPWDGALPAPRAISGFIERYWWDSLRRPGTVRALLRLVYADYSRLDARLEERILEPTRHPAAVSAFTSIAFAPKSEATFDELAARVEAPICMVYGRDDPWVVPLWGQRLKRRVPDATYYEVSPAGHCPQHERPELVAPLVRGWIDAVQTGAAPPLQAVLKAELRLPCTPAVEGAPRDAAARLVDGRPRNPFEWVSALLDRRLEVVRSA